MTCFLNYISEPSLNLDFYLIIEMKEFKKVSNIKIAMKEKNPNSTKPIVNKTCTAEYIVGFAAGGRDKRVEEGRK